MKYIHKINDKTNILNSDWNIEIDKDDFEILMIHIKALSRKIDDITQFINTNTQD